MVGEEKKPNPSPPKRGRGEKFQLPQYIQGKIQGIDDEKKPNPMAWDRGLGGDGVGIRPTAAEPSRADRLWELARSKQNVHRFSTLLTAQDVRDRLSTEKGLAAAARLVPSDGRHQGLCRIVSRWLHGGEEGPGTSQGSFPGGRLDRLGLRHDRPRRQTPVGGWNPISCYTDPATQDKIQKIFEYAAGMFDEIMIDDFWFTDCNCPDCEAARQARKVVVGDKTLSC